MEWRKARWPILATWHGEAGGVFSMLLPERHHETILRDQTVNQAAEALGIPVGTAKSRVY